MATVLVPKVRLRVVGVFYDKSFDMQPGDTIKTLLNKAVRGSAPHKTAGAFSYTTKVALKDDGVNPPFLFDSLVSFSHFLQATIDPSLGGRERKQGLYELSESTSVFNDSVTVHAWQYYVIREGKAFSNYWKGVPVFDVSPASPKDFEAEFPAFPAGKSGFTPFDRVPLNPGDEVVWRNVSIVRNPQTLP